MSQLYSLVELLQKQAAAAIRNGVVGRIGNTMPIAPKLKQTRPEMSHSALVTLFPFFLQLVVSETMQLSIMNRTPAI